MERHSGRVIRVESVEPRYEVGFPNRFVELGGAGVGIVLSRVEAGHLALRALSSIKRSSNKVRNMDHAKRLRDAAEKISERPVAGLYRVVCPETWLRYEGETAVLSFGSLVSLNEAMVHVVELARVSPRSQGHRTENFVNEVVGRINYTADVLSGV